MDDIGSRRGTRQDVLRNRAMILTAAIESLQGVGGGVPSLHREVIRRTGLGRATVYRHFRDQRALAEAAVGEGFRHVKRGAAEAVAGGSLREVLSRVLRAQAAMRPATSVIRALPESVQRRCLGLLVGHLRPAFEQARIRGEIRSGVTADDLVVIMTMLDAAADGSPRIGSRTADMDRFIDIVLDGLFVGDRGQEPGTGAA